jgi:hypothetical protein
MKRLFSFALVMIATSALAQTSFTTIDKNTQMVKRECEIIIITTDSLVASNMRNNKHLSEESLGYSSNFKNVIMFWFKLDDENEVINSLNPFLVKVD